jgi:putative acetyltransferase
VEVRIVDGRDDDRDGLIALIESVYAEYEGVIFDREEIPELEAVAGSFARAGGRFWCAFAGDRLVGCVGFTPVDSDGIELKKLYVARDARRHGLGGRLTQRVEDEGRARGAAYVELWSDVKFVTAHRFYEERGYQRDGRRRHLHDKSDTVEYHFRLPL